MTEFEMRRAEVRSGKKRERYTSYLSRLRKQANHAAVPRIVKIDWNVRSEP